MKKKNGSRLLHRRKSAGAMALLSILCCLCAGVTVSAEDALQIGIDQYEVTDEGNILVYVNQNGEEEFVPSAQESSLLIGKNTLSVTDISSFSERGEPITYMCLVDISGSMTEDGITHTKEVLRQFVEDKGPEDNLCITTMGNDMKSSGFLSDEKELTDAVEDIARVGTEDTNLYYSVKEALDVLKTNRAVNQKRCLLIFSDGEDDQKKGITQKEAEDAVKDSHIPVFTVALAGKNLKDEEESAKILGSFARSSAGGEHYAPIHDDRYEYGDICSAVRGRLDTSLIVTANLSGLKEVGDDTVYIGVELSDGTRHASDGITAPAGKIIEAVEEIRERGQEDAAEISLPEPEEKPVRTSKINTKTLVGGILLLLAAMLAVIAVLVRRKAAEREEEELEERDYDGAGYENGGGCGEADDGGAGYEEMDGGIDSRGISFQSGDVTAPGFSGYGKAETPIRKKESRRKQGKVEMTLFPIGPGEVQPYRFTVKEKATIGRNKTCSLVLEEDTALSGVHCSIIYRDGCVYVKDEESTNGTFINGVPIVGEHQAEKDDVLLIGSSEYRMVWE